MYMDVGRSLPKFLYSLHVRCLVYMSSRECPIVVITGPIHQSSLRDPCEDLLKKMKGYTNNRQLPPTTENMLTDAINANIP